MSGNFLVKIRNVTLYTGKTAGEADCEAAKKLLTDASVKFTTLDYADLVDHHTANFKALSTWSCGPDGYKKECTDFPILVWDECFNDWTVYRHIAHGLKEIEACSVLKNHGVVEK